MVPVEFPRPGIELAMGDNTIRVIVLLFGACRESTGVSEVKLDLARPADAADAWRELKRFHPSLERFERSALVAINEEHARRDQQLSDGDVLAIFPPVSGGLY